MVDMVALNDLHTNLNPIKHLCNGLEWENPNPHAIDSNKNL